jgi:leader peptidase (prepilin peptidase)/N-methyltransferase
MIGITFGGVLYTFLVVFAFGACIGSFLNVCIYRIPREESVVTPRSHCPHCGKLIAWYDNIPILSWLFLGAKCRHCGGGISMRYILVEALIGVLFSLVWLLYGIHTDSAGEYWLLLDARIPVYWLIVAGLSVATFIDFEHFIIPDRISLGGIPAGIALSVLVPTMQGAATRWDGFNASVMGAVAGAGILWGVGAVGKLIFKKDAMGMGDVKLLGAIGAFMGWRCVLFTIVASSFFGSFVGMGLIMWGGRKWQSRIPYGPYIAMGAVLWLLWGHQWWQAYMQWVMTP